MARCSRCWWCRSCWPRGAPLRRVGAAGAGGRRPGGEHDPRLHRHRARTRTGALRAAAAAAVVGGPGEQLRRRCRSNLRPIGLLAVGLPLATTFAVGFVAYKTVPELTIAAALTLGAIVAPPDAVSATAVGPQARAAAPDHDAARRRKPAQRRDRADRLQGRAGRGDRHRRDAGAAASARSRSRRAAASWSAALLGVVIAFIRWRLNDPLVESAIGLVAPFVIYLAAEEAHGSGVLAVVVAALHPRSAVLPRRLRDPAAGPARCGRPCSWCWSRSRS